MDYTKHYEAMCNEAMAMKRWHFSNCEVRKEALDA